MTRQNGRLPVTFDIGMPLLRRNVCAAAATLFMVMAGHTVLETARDSLFLQRMPITQLPWTYLSIAVAALAAAELNGRLRAFLDLRRSLALTLLIGALGAFTFLQGFKLEAALSSHAFYVWVAVVATLAVGQFWLLMSELFTVSDAKSHYAAISAGGLLGAIFGGMLSHFVARAYDDLILLYLGGSLFSVAAAVTFCTRLPETSRLVESLPPTPASKAGRGSAMRDLRSERYLRRLLGLTLISTVAATLIDYNFKTEVARTIAPENLGGFFGTFNAGLSGVALLVQFALAPRLLTQLGVGRSLLVLPSLLTAAAIGSLVVPGLASALIVRGTDGSLRFSLQRTASEVLYLPLPARARARWKMIVEAIGQRGGQALASLVILCSVAVQLPSPWMNALAAGLAGMFLVVSATMESQYLALFRAKIKAGAVETRAEVPALDLHALETLVASLGSDTDEEVLASIDLLVDYHRERVIPSLLLYHPSRAVVLRTLEVFTNAGRRDLAGPARRLLEREDDEIRAAAMVALTRHIPAAQLHRELDTPLPIAARAAVLVAVITQGLDHTGEAAREVAAGCEPSAPLSTRLAFARAFRMHRDLTSVPRLLVLAEEAPPELALETARAMLVMPHTSFIPALIKMLDTRIARRAARDALVAIGPAALLALSEASANLSYPRRLRAHFPRSISRFDSAAAADILLDRLDRETDGWVRFKIIRGLGQLRSHMPTRTRSRRVFEHARRNLSRAVRFMAFRIATEHDIAADPRRGTKGSELLVAVLQDKEHHAVDRAVRLVGLLQTANVIHNIRQTLGGNSHRLRAEGLELLVHRVPPDIAQALIAFLDDTPDSQERLERAAEALDQELPGASYEERLAMLLEDDSEAVRSVAAYHVGELRLSELNESFARAAARTSGLSWDTFARVREMLEEPRQPTQPQLVPARRGT